MRSSKCMAGHQWSQNGRLIATSRIILFFFMPCMLIATCLTKPVWLMRGGQGEWRVATECLRSNWRVVRCHCSQRDRTRCGVRRGVGSCRESLPLLQFGWFSCQAANRCWVDTKKRCGRFRVPQRFECPNQVSNSRFRILRRSLPSTLSCRVYPTGRTGFASRL